MSNDVFDSSSSFSGSNFAFISATLSRIQASSLSAAASLKSSSSSCCSLRPSVVSRIGLIANPSSYSASRYAVRSALAFAISSAVGAAGAAGEQATASAAKAVANINRIDISLHTGPPGSCPAADRKARQSRPTKPGRSPAVPDQPAFTFVTQRFTRASSTGRGNAPPPSTVSWNPA